MSAGIEACAGLGLFFVGMRTITAHLRELAGGKVRALLARTLHRRGVGPVAGFLAGALTQSTSAVTFIAVGLVAAGAMTVTPALAMLAWANVGTSVLVLVAAIDMHALVLYLLALVGAAYFAGMEQTDRYRHGVVSLLGLALLLFGLAMLKSAVASIHDDVWVREFVEFAGSGSAVAFLMAFVVAVAVSSSSIVVMLALPLVQQGLLSMDATVLMVLGASAGSGAAVVLLSSNLDGTSRQVAVCQGMLRCIAAAALLPLYFLEHDYGVPLMLAGVSRLTASLATQAGLLFLIAQAASVLVVAVAGRWLIALAASLSPAAPVDSLGQPVYLFEGAMEDPATALSLVRLEHAALVAALPDFLDDLRPAGERRPGSPPLAARQAASGAVLAATERFLAGMLRTNPEMSAEVVFEARRGLVAFGELQGAIGQFATELLSVPAAERPAFAVSLIEGLHALLGMVVDACGPDAADSRELLALLTAERGELVERVRAELRGGSASIAGREALLSATLLFERIVWMLRQQTALPPLPEGSASS
ncbi:MAG: Na/Pi symporter [Pseudomonadota bacterium]